MQRWAMRRLGGGMVGYEEAGRGRVTTEERRGGEEFSRKERQPKLGLGLEQEVLGYI